MDILSQQKVDNIYDLFSYLDAETRRLCLQFAILNASSNPTLPTWLISWLNPSIFLSLEVILLFYLPKRVSTVKNLLRKEYLKYSQHYKFSNG